MEPIRALLHVGTPRESGTKTLHAVIRVHLRFICVHLRSNAFGFRQPRRPNFRVAV